MQLNLFEVVKENMSSNLRGSLVRKDGFIYINICLGQCELLCDAKRGIWEV